MKQSTKLCLISLLCMFVLPTIVFFIVASTASASGTNSPAYKLMIPVTFTCYVVGWVLAVMSRNKYKDTFSMVLLIIYGILLVCTLIGIIVAVSILAGLG